MNAEQEQQQDVGYDYPQYLPQVSRNDRADLLDKIKPDVIVETIRHRLMGEEFKDAQWIPVKGLQGRHLSEVGAWELANLLLSISNINTTISNLKDFEVKKRALRIAKTSQYLCITNWRTYGITNCSQLWFVHEIMFGGALMVLKQTDQASIQELIKGTVQENRIYQNAGGSKEGVLSRAKRALFG